VDRSGRPAGPARQDVGAAVGPLDSSGQRRYLRLEHAGRGREVEARQPLEPVVAGAIVRGERPLCPFLSCGVGLSLLAGLRPSFNGPELLRAILRKCVDEWEWLERAPKIRVLKEPVRRIRFLRHEEAQRLIAALPEHLAAMASFTLATGLRAANVTGLQWTQVDLVRRVAWIHPDQAKARRAIPVPLNNDAVLLLRQRLGKHPLYVFSYHGKRITQVSTKAWYAALKRAGIADFRWHDLRHTWASWHVQNGTPLFALQELGGWASTDMVRRYAHLAADHLAPYAERLGTLRAVEICDGPKTAQPEKS